MLRRPTLKIGSFSAASNVTGIITDTCAIASLLHEHGALSCWDYAAVAAPYVDIDMNPGAKSTRIRLRRGGPQPAQIHRWPRYAGVLAIRRELVTNSVPDVVGGGTVAFVAPERAQLPRRSRAPRRGGTPAIVESIRAGLVFKLKASVGPAVIRAHEDDLVRRAISAWQRNPAIGILGNTEAERLSIVSFTIKRPGSGGRYLHHNLVVAILNDLFGIQARGGCSCAGPYGHRLLGISEQVSEDYQQQILAAAGHQAGMGAGELQLLHL